MRRAERGAYYIIYRGNGLKFLNYNPETKVKNLTSCPHDATLFTSQATAERFAEDLRGQTEKWSPQRVVVVPTRTHAPNVLTGAGKP